MGIYIAWQNESGDELASMVDSKNHIAHILGSINFKSTSCLRFIDPYGNTVFNRHQIPLLIEELEKVRPEISDPAQMTFFRELLHFIKKREDLIHIYLKFIGD